MSELVVIIDGNAVTTTTVIAEGTSNEHASVIALVRKYLSDMEDFGLVDFKSQSTGGRPTEYAVLNEQQSTLLLTYMRNSEVVRAFKKRLVKRFWEMTDQLRSSFHIPQSLPEALRLAADLAEEKKALEQKVEQDAPKVEVYERISDAEGSMCLRDAAKTLQIQPSKLNAWLQANGWIYKRVGKGGWLAYQDKIQSGHLIHKSTPYIDETNGENRVSEQVRVTPKGLTRIAELLDKTAPRRPRQHNQGSPQLGMH